LQAMRQYCFNDSEKSFALFLRHGLDGH
jgi:hypothetical protein